VSTVFSTHWFSRHTGYVMFLQICMIASLALAIAASPLSLRWGNPISLVPLGKKWEICIHKPIKHDSVGDFIPSEAAIWDIDLGHARDYPKMIPNLKVCTSPGF
jgi:inner membrane protein involved in colicin E2 resistance